MLGERLRRARIKAGLRQIDLAVGIGRGYDHTVISAIERGRCSMRIEALERAADTLGVTTDYLLGRSDDEQQSTPPEPRPPVPAGEGHDARLANVLEAISEHYTNLNDYAREVFLDDIRHHFPSLGWQRRRRSRPPAPPQPPAAPR